MSGEREIRLLVDWDDPMVAVPRDQPAAPAPVAKGPWEPRLLVDWRDPFAHARRDTITPVTPIPPPLFDEDIRLLVNWSDDLAEARRRESAMAAAIAHLVVIILALFGPQIFPTREPSAAEEEEKTRSALALLYIPPDLVIPPAEPQPDLTPEERKRASVRTPLTVDPRELELILPPPAPPPGSLPPGSPSPSVPGSDRPPSTIQSELDRRGEPPREIARLEDLPSRPQSSRPGLALPESSPRRAIEESLRPGQGVPGGAPGGPGGPGGPMQPNLSVPYPLILSDPRGVDFGPYLIRLLHEVRRNWYAATPISVYWGEKGKVVIIFTIKKDGSVPPNEPTIVASSGRSHLDRPTLAAIRASQPFPPLPSEFTGEQIVLQFTFLYNLPLDYTGP